PVAVCPHPAHGDPEAALRAWSQHLRPQSPEAGVRDHQSRLPVAQVYPEETHPASMNMLPRISADNTGNRRARYAEAHGDDIVRVPPSSHSADFANGVVGEFGLPMPLAGVVSENLMTVFDVLAVRHPFEIGEAVIAPQPV